jgi:deoxyribose-phosphate aldolase
MAAYIDHTYLSPLATPDDIARLCSEAADWGFAAVCVSPCYVRQAAELLHGTPVRVCTVIGFPLGVTLPDVKAYEAQRVIQEGANEIDMVINIGALKAGHDELVRREIEGVVKAADRSGVLVRVIIETAALTDEEKVRACSLAKSASADFVKISTAYGPGGASLHDVALMRRTVGPSVGVKASTGVRDYETAKAMIEAGATRLGVSRAIKIMRQAEEARQRGEG